MMLRVLPQRLCEPCIRSAIARQIWQDNPKLNWPRQYVGRLSFFPPAGSQKYPDCRIGQTMVATWSSSQSALIGLPPEKYATTLKMNESRQSWCQMSPVYVGCSVQESFVQDSSSITTLKLCKPYLI